MILSDLLAPKSFEGIAEIRAFMPQHVLPTEADFESVDGVFLFGPLQNASAATALAGDLALAHQNGTTIVCAYRQHLGHEALVLSRVGVPHPNYTGQATFTQPRERTFETYLTKYGVSGTTWSRNLEGAVTLGTVDDDPTAFYLEPVSPRGALYVVPFHLPSQASVVDMVTGLIKAVGRHRSVLATDLPLWLSGINLGKAELDATNELDRLTREVDHARGAVEGFIRWRHLIGTTTGEALVRLIVDALNVLLDGTEYRAETRTDVGEEDFWIIGQGVEVALGEAKGVSGGVSRTYVSQVDIHRGAVGHDEVLPGLLIVNVFRKHEDVVQREKAEVAPNVVNLAKAQNVLVLHTWDLYQLIGLRMNGRDVGKTLIHALGEGGGWLRVRGDSVVVEH